MTPDLRRHDPARRPINLGRLRLGVEPIEVQVERYRRVTWLLTALPVAIGLFIVTLFTAFGRPGIGVVVALVLFVPVVSIAWVDFAVLQGRATRYLREQADIADIDETATPDGA